MTTAATVVGHFPLVLATGPGAGARNSIGIMLVSGMIIGTLFTLFVVPSIYMLVARTRVAEPAAAQDDVRIEGAPRLAPSMSRPRVAPSPGAHWTVLTSNSATPKGPGPSASCWELVVGGE